MKAVILRPFHREWAKCDGTHSVAAIMFCGSTLCHHQPHLYLLLAMYKIGRSGTRSKFWSLTLILRLWWSSADMILSMCICSNASKDEECDKFDPILREVGQLLRKPIGLEQEDTIWWRWVPVYIFALLPLICFVSWQGGSKSALKHQLVQEWENLLLKHSLSQSFKVLLCQCKALNIFKRSQFKRAPTA